MRQNRIFSDFPEKDSVSFVVSEAGGAASESITTNHSTNEMKLRSFLRGGLTCAAFALLALATPASADDYGVEVKQTKVKDHKVKVKVVGGKAKIKEKANGKQKVKVKGPNGGAAAAIATDLGEQRDSPELYGYSK